MTANPKRVSQTQWYISAETPAPLAQPMGSPVPPPRQRHNPFNKLDANPHQRSHSLRSAPGKHCFVYNFNQLTVSNCRPYG